jgi:hypothetical protein
MNTQHKLRYIWYQAMTALDEDREAQIKGTVIIGYFHGLTADHTDFFSNSCFALTKLPFRTVAVHLCYDSPILHPAMSLIQEMTCRQIRIRFRHHFGK